MTISRPTGNTARVLACLLASSAFGAAGAATLTVAPGQSIQAAVNAAAPGDTVRVLAGTYVQKVLISGKSGSAGAPITLKADTGVTLSGQGLKPAGREGLITLRNANYIRVEGFELAGFTASGNNTPVGILIEGNGGNLQIVNNKIHGIKNTSTCKDPCSTGAHGLAVFGKNATGVTDLLLQNNEVYRNVLQSSEAVVINGNVDRFEVLGNNVHDNNNIGFDFIGYENECNNCGESDRARNGIVRGNRSVNNSSAKNPWYGGEGSAGGFYVDGGRNIIFDGNVSTGNDIGFEFASEHGGKATEDILMTNNAVYKNLQAGLSLGGYSSSAGQSRRKSARVKKAGGLELPREGSVPPDALNVERYNALTPADAPERAIDGSRARSAARAPASCPHANSDSVPLSSASGMVSRSPRLTSWVVGCGTRFHGVTTASHQAVNRPDDQDRRLSSTSGSTAAMAFGSWCIVIIPAPQRA